MTAGLLSTRPTETSCAPAEIRCPLGRSTISVGVGSVPFRPDADAHRAKNATKEGTHHVRSI
jgi:hypothetical protein